MRIVNTNGKVEIEGVDGSTVEVRAERIARGAGLDGLTLQSSITAEPFYSALGYEVVSRGELTIAPQLTMAAVTMRKALA